MSMGDSDESVFWDEREEEYGGGGAFTSQDDFQSNDQYRFETANQTINYDDEESGSKRIRLSPDSDHLQEGDEDSSSSQSSPLGLTLRKTPSFLNLLQRSLSKGKHTHFSTTDIQLDKATRKIEELGSQSSISEKLKASNFPAFLIKIGSWQRMTRHEGDLTAKLYYAKRKLVWEVLDGALKSKIEIQWSDISAIRAVTPNNDTATLEIELNQPPLFYREINPQPRKHTLWQQSSDFTGGQAPIWRRHYVRFPPGVLDKHYEKLLQCDERLLALSQKPFPTNTSPYFDPNMFGISQLSLIFNTYGSSHLQQHPYPAGPSLSSLAQPAPYSTAPVMADFTSANDIGTSWAQPTQPFPFPFPFHSHHQHYPQPNVGLHLVGESHAASSSEAVRSLLDPTDAHGYYTHEQITTHIATDFSPNIAQPHAHYWLQPPHQHSNNNNDDDDDSVLLMEQQMSSNSLPPFFLPGKNPTAGDFY